MLLNRVKLSIIIPVYNVEGYLRKCIDSVLIQDYDDYEIILVDDGSTDSCPAICDEYACTPYTVHHTPIKVIHQPNAGLSAARNSGIKIANGDYIMFVDSDDYIKPNVLGLLMQQVERDKLDVLRFNYQNVNEQYEVFNSNKAQKRDVDYSEVVTDGETFLNERLGPMCYAVMFIIRRNLIIGDRRLKIGDCLFKEGIYFEDTEWTPRMLLRAKRVASTPMIVYNYLWRSGSITLPTDPVKREKVIHDKIALLSGFKEQRKLVKNPIWFDWMTSFNTMTVLNALASIPASERKPYFEELKSLHIFPLLTKKEKVLSHRIKIGLANISPSLYCSLMSLRI